MRFSDCAISAVVQQYALAYPEVRFTLLLVLPSSYAVGRVHQWYTHSLRRDLAFREGYDHASHSMFDLANGYAQNGMPSYVDLQERVHHNQQLEGLSKMSFAIIQTVVRRLERRYERNFLEDVNKTMKLIRYDKDVLYLDINEIAELERSAMIEIPEYGKLWKT